MKKLQPAISRYLLKIEARWQKLTTGKQRRIIVYVFCGYVVLTVAVVGNVCLDRSRTTGPLRIRHIENPVLKAATGSKTDSLLQIFKTRTYGKQKEHRQGD